MELNSEQAAAVALRGRSVLVSAAAGAGKTRVLVERLMAYVREDGRNVDEFLLITFTRAAAGEMRARVFKRLREWGRQEPRDPRPAEQLRRLPLARICTLDAYCQEIVSENAALLGLPNTFRVPDEARHEALCAHVMEETLDALYEQYAQLPEAPFSVCAEAYGDARGDKTLRDMALELWRKTRAHPAPTDWLHARLADLSAPAEKWDRLLLAGDRDRLAFIREQYASILPALLSGGYAESYALTHAADTAQMDKLSPALAEGRVRTASLLPTLSLPRLVSARVKKGQEAPDPVAGDLFKELRKKWGLFLGKLRERYAASPEEEESSLRLAASQIAGIGELLHRFDEALWREKLRLRCPDFADIRLKALELLCPDGAKGVYALRYGLRFHEIMVDEYQDINPLQNSLIDALSQNGQNVFYVGDVRQSIYRFQLAEPALFRDKFAACRSYTQEDLCGAAEKSEPLRVILRENYRSHPAILAAVNHVFSRIDCPEMGVLPPEAFLCSGGTHADRDGGEQAVEWLPLADSEEEAVALRLRALCDSGRYRPSDCVILLRSGGARPAAFRRALEAVGLPLLAVGGEGYLGRPEILQLRAALRVVRNARDESALAALLYGPLLSLTPDDLAALRGLSEGTLGDCLQASKEPRLIRFCERLTRWRSLSADLPPYELCAAVLADTRLPGLYSGAARENLLLFPELLRTYQGELAGLEDWLSRQESRAAAPPRAGAADTGAVRLMTIHKSKGLEFPVVVVAGLSKRWNTEDQKARLLVHPRHGLGPRCQDELCHYPTGAYRALAEILQSEARSEELRLLYVAMTRAVDKLILAGADGAKPLTQGGFIGRGAFLDAPGMAAWLATLREASWFSPALSDAPSSETVLPPSDGAEATLLVRPVPYPFAKAVQTPAKLTATGIAVMLAERESCAAPSPPSLPPPRPPRLDGTPPPLSPAQKGTALHKFMQFARYEACESPQGAKAELCRLEKAALLSPIEAAAVSPALISAFFAGETGRRLLAQDALERERRFSLLVRDGDVPELSLPTGEELLLQGVIDCYFARADGQLVLLDFKTDRVNAQTLPERVARYTPQLNVYAAALERMTGHRVAEKLLCFLQTGLCVVAE